MLAAGKWLAANMALDGDISGAELVRNLCAMLSAAPAGGE
jgi:hypothetical protein